jgi:hypothetical protein
VTKAKTKDTGGKTGVWRVARTVAVVATAVGGMTAFVGPAGAAATGPTAGLDQGTVTVTGTAVRDVVDISIGHVRLAVDFGADGTVEARFRLSRVQRVSVRLGGGRDGLSVIGRGVGDVPITVRGGAGSDAVGVVGTEDALLADNAPVAIFGGDGNDDLSASVPGSAAVSVDAGLCDDVVFGGDGSIGPETISLGDGNDKFVSTLDVFASPFRARSDILDGGSGKGDALELRGTFESETVDLPAHAGHLIVQHDLRDHLDAAGIEGVTWFGFGGNDETGSGDTVIVHDLSGTGVVDFTPDFSSPFDATAPNNSFDTLAVLGTGGDDQITVSAFNPANIDVVGLTPAITSVLMDSNDLLQINTLDGNDTVDSSGLPPNLVQLQVL